jgi:hypothetical protein
MHSLLPVLSVLSSIVMLFSALLLLPLLWLGWPTMACAEGRFGGCSRTWRCMRRLPY